jgi:hypothetical protein
LPTITQQWDDAHAVLDSDRPERRRDTKAKDAPASLLRGLIFAPDGERLMPTYTIKKGKTGQERRRDRPTGGVVQLDGQ